MAKRVFTILTLHFIALAFIGFAYSRSLTSAPAADAPTGSIGEKLKP